MRLRGRKIYVHLSRCLALHERETVPTTCNAEGEKRQLIFVWRGWVWIEEGKGGGFSGAPVRKRSREGVQKSGGSVGSSDHGVEVAVGVMYGVDVVVTQGCSLADLRHLFACGPTGSGEGENFDSLCEDKLRGMLVAASVAAVAYEDTIKIPEFLCNAEDMTELAQQVAPSWVPLSPDITSQPGVDVLEEGTRGVSQDLNFTMRKLSNGVRVVYKRTPFEKKQLSMELHLLGGRACEGHVEGIKTGALSLGLQTAMESGLGVHSYDSLVRYCQLHGNGCSKVERHTRPYPPILAHTVSPFQKPIRDRQRQIS